MKDAFAPLHPTLDYRRLDYAAGTAVELPLTVLTDSGIAGDAEVAWSVRGLDGATYAKETRTAHVGGCCGQPRGRRRVRHAADWRMDWCWCA